MVFDSLRFSEGKLICTVSSPVEKDFVLSDSFKNFFFMLWFGFKTLFKKRQLCLLHFLHLERPCRIHCYLLLFEKKQFFFSLIAIFSNRLL